jgi:cytochrome c peroxidase
MFSRVARLDRFGLIVVLGGLPAIVTTTACSVSDSGPDRQGNLATIQEGLSAPALQQQLLSSFGYRPLSREPIPQPQNGHIVNQQAAVRLGKAFFWDIQAGSDGQVACATCHSSFGADGRRFNTINPGNDEVFDVVTGPNQTYTPALISDNDDIVGSQGVARGVFVSVNPDPKIAGETCTAIVDPTYGTARRVEFRQAPMIYGAAFFRSLFWGGEAFHRFNGLNIWGFTGNSLPGSITDIENAALASQASGPVNNSVEMRCTGRPLNGATNSLGAKMLARQPLQFQRVSPSDSVLGALANPAGPGLVCGGAPCSYRAMIAEAFGPALAGDAENVFSMLWGESIQAYEMTLIPDRTPFDRFLSGRFEALTPRQVFGLIRFVGKGKCATCHAGPMFSDATVAFYRDHGPLNRDGGDQGFHNIGLVNAEIDIGRGDVGPGDVPLSDSQSPFDQWAFKTPTLRNIKFTAPYFHAGTKPTLEDVMDFYNRGGDFANPQRSADIQELGLTSAEKAAIIDFMANGLSDCRVEKQRAPFDHPELPVANGPVLPAVGAAGIGPCRDRDDRDDHDDADRH